MAGIDTISSPPVFIFFFCRWFTPEIGVVCCCTFITFFSSCSVVVSKNKALFSFRSTSTTAWLLASDHLASSRPYPRVPHSRLGGLSSHAPPSTTRSRSRRSCSVTWPNVPASACSIRCPLRTYSLVFSYIIIASNVFFRHLLDSLCTKIVLNFHKPCCCATPNSERTAKHLMNSRSSNILRV